MLLGSLWRAKIYRSSNLGAKLNPDSLLSFIWKHYEDFLDMAVYPDDRNDRLRNLAHGIEDWTDVKNKWLNPDRTTPTVLRDLLNTPDFQRQFESIFRIPAEAFSQPDHSHLKQFLASKAIVSDYTLRRPELLIHETSRDFVAQETYLAAPEVETLNELSKAICQPRKAFFSWTAPLVGGASWIARQLYSSATVRAQYKHIFHVFVDPNEGYCTPQLGAIFEALNIDPNRYDNYGSIASALLNQAVLIVIHRAETIGKQPSILDKLVSELATKNSDHKRASMLFLSTQREHVFSSEPNVTPLSKLHETLTVRMEDRFALYKLLLGRFLKLRGCSTEIDPSDARIKRAEFHYAEVNRELPIYPATIKLRALFASNLKNESYYDATLGFKRLVDRDSFEGLEDIESLRHETVTFLQTLEAEGSKSETLELQLLRLASTSLYWLSDDSFEKFQKIPNFKKLTASKARSLANSKRQIADVLDELPRDSHKHARYVMSLGIKAIVQDHWMENQARTRSKAHRMVAQKLFDGRAITELKQEYPFESREDGGSIFFVAEAIRHLMRSIEIPTHQSEPLAADDFSWLSGDWTDDRISDAGIWLAAFRHLYGLTLMGGKKRRLVREHGLFLLRLEVLHLLSRGRDLAGNGIIPNEDQEKFLADLAFTLLDLGRLDEAQALYEQRRDLANSTGEAHNQVRAFMELAMVLSVQGKLIEARQNMETARQISDHVVDMPDPSLRERLEARFAHLDYLEGSYDQAIARFKSLEKVSERPSISSERAHAYIAALAASYFRASEQERERPPLAARLPKAIAVCIANMTSSAFAKRNHEALGFAISLAHLYRNMNLIEPAEACLDQVYLDILTFGCSERTYIEFLREAGRVLLARGNFARAYAAYLLPCLERPSTALMDGVAKSVIDAANEALTGLITQAERFKGDSDGWRKELEANLQTPQYLKGAVTPSVREDQPVADPLHSFGLRDTHPWLTKFDSVESIQKEALELSVKARKVRIPVGQGWVF